MHESNKSDNKDARIIDNNDQNEKFEVIKEEVKDDNQQINYHDNKNNSDFKRFNIDDDNYNDQMLRIDKTAQFKPVYQTSDNIMTITELGDFNKNENQ